MGASIRTGMSVPASAPIKSATIAVALAVASSLPVPPANAATFRVATDETNLGFAVSNFGIGSHQGRFELTWGKITLDPEQRSGTIDFVVDVRSVNTGWDLRDTFLRSDLMFDAERYPSIHFHSTRLAFDGPRLVAVDGEMTLHGVTRPSASTSPGWSVAPRSAWHTPVAARRSPAESRAAHSECRLDIRWSATKSRWISR
jgi:hypothetical protein